MTLAGCSEPAPPQPAKPSEQAGPQSGVALTVLVAGDAELFEGIQLLRGEWTARNGGALAVTNLTLEDLEKPAAAGAIAAADVVVFPSRLLGDLAERGALQPIRKSVLESKEFGITDVFPAIRNGEMKYGGEVLALPLGSPPLLAIYSEDALQSRGGSPRTWADYRRFIAAEAHPRQQADNAKGKARRSSAAALPLADGRAALVLIARGAAYADSAARSDALFSADDMTPRISTPPFVRALAEIAEEGAIARGERPLDLATALELVQTQNASAAFGWPGCIDVTSGEAPKAVLGAIKFAPLPAADEVFSVAQNRWQSQTAPDNLTVLGAEGRLVGVTRATRNAVSAFKLCQWLTTGERAIELSSRSRSTLWFRASQATSAHRWRGGAATHGSDGAVETVRDALNSTYVFLLPRVPGIDQYLAALDAQVFAAANGERTPAEALQLASHQWEAITERLGRSRQLVAYRRHLGIDSFAEPKSHE